MTKTIKLFNSKDLKKMRVQNSYRLALLKLESLLISHAGHVDLNGDRYTYNGRPIVKFNHIHEFIVIELISPCFPENLLLPEEHTDPKLRAKFGNHIKHMKFIIGHNCAEEFDELLDHINSVNNKHIFREEFVAREKTIQAAAKYAVNE